MKFQKLIFITWLCFLSTVAFAQDKMIPMSDKVYQGKYFLITNQKLGNINTVIYKAKYKVETVFSKMEVNCSSGKIRAIGEGINSIKDLTEFSDKGNWSIPVTSSTRDDVARFVCKK